MTPLLYNRSCPRRSARQRAADLLERVGLADRLDHKPNQLSGGQQQRVAIARALVNQPPILLCDEPTGNLDTRTSREIMAFFRKLNETEGLTVILVTHDLEVARRAKRALVLIDGEVVVDTTDFDVAAETLHRRAAGRDDAAMGFAGVNEGQHAMGRVVLAGSDRLGRVRLRASGLRRPDEPSVKNIILPEQRTHRLPRPRPASARPHPRQPAAANRHRPAARTRRSGGCRWTRPSASRLQNAKVIRVLAGTTAVASGQTIYDAGDHQHDHRPGQRGLRPRAVAEQHLEPHQHAAGRLRPARPDPLPHHQLADGRLPRHIGA